MIPELTELNPADYRISVVLPVFSETETVRLIADWLRQTLGERLLEIIVVVSPHSSAESRAVCDGLAAEDERIRVFVQKQNPGVGHAFREGYAQVRGNVVRGGGFVGYSRFKRLLNWGFQQLFRWLFWTPLHDLTYGFKVLRAEVVHGIVWEASLHEVGCETTLKPIRLGVSAGEVPSTWTARTQGRSTNNFWRNFRYVAMAWRILTHGVERVVVEPTRDLSPAAQR